MAGNFNPIRCNEPTACSVCLEDVSGRGDVVAHEGGHGEAHPYHKECARNYTIHNPENPSCFCKTPYNPYSLLTPPEYLAALVMREYTKFGEREEAAAENERAALQFAAQDGNGLAVADDAAIAQALHQQLNGAVPAGGHFGVAVLPPVVPVMPPVVLAPQIQGPSLKSLTAIGIAVAVVAVAVFAAQYI